MKSIKSVKKPSCMSQGISYVGKRKAETVNRGTLSSVPLTRAKTDSGQRDTLINVAPGFLPELPEAAMPGWIGEIVRAVCENSEVNPAAVLVSVLLNFAAMIDAPYIEYDGTKHHCRTNAVIIGQSSKSWKATSDAAVKRIFDGMPNQAQNIQSYMLTGESLIYAVGDGAHPLKNRHRNQLATAPGVSNKCLLFQEQEFRSALANAKRPGNSLSQIISGFFDYGCAKQVMKSGEISATGAHVVILARTCCLDYSLLRNDVQQSNGFASHFLWILFDRINLVPRPKSMPDSEVIRFRNIITECIQAANGLTEVKMSKPAAMLWSDIYPYLTHDVPGVTGAVLSRLEIHTIRIALIYALAAGRKKIQTQDLNAAYALVQYARESALYIFKGEANDNIKGKILCALHTAANQEMSRTEISSKVFNRNVDSDVIKDALNEMEKMNLIEVKKVSGTGRQKTVYKLASR
jgi:hypothetical protein